MSGPVSSDPVSTVEAQVDKVGEPVVIGHAVVWVLAMAGQFVIGHTPVTHDQWGTVSSMLIPTLTTALLAASAWFIRTKVSPAAVQARRVEAEVRRRLALVPAPVPPAATVTYLPTLPTDPPVTVVSPDSTDLATAALARMNAIHPLAA